MPVRKSLFSQSNMLICTVNGGLLTGHLEGWSTAPQWCKCELQPVTLMPLISYILDYFKGFLLCFVFTLNHSIVFVSEVHTIFEIWSRVEVKKKCNIVYSIEESITQSVLTAGLCKKCSLTVLGLSTVPSCSWHFHAFHRFMADQLLITAHLSAAATHGLFGDGRLQSGLHGSDTHIHKVMGWQHVTGHTTHRSPDLTNQTATITACLAL